MLGCMDALRWGMHYVAYGPDEMKAELKQDVIAKGSGSCKKKLAQQSKFLQIQLA